MPTIYYGLTVPYDEATFTYHPDYVPVPEVTQEEQDQEYMEWLCDFATQNNPGIVVDTEDDGLYIGITEFWLGPFGRVLPVADSLWDTRIKDYCTKYGILTQREPRFIIQ